MAYNFGPKGRPRYLSEWGIPVGNNHGSSFTPFNMSLSSSEILLSLVDNHSIYTPCHMSLPLSKILQRLPLGHVSIIVHVPAIALQILFRDLVVTCMHAGASSAWTLARWQPAVNQFYFLQYYFKRGVPEDTRHDRSIICCTVNIFYT